MCVYVCVCVCVYVCLFGCFRHGLVVYRPALTPPPPAAPSQFATPKLGYELPRRVFAFDHVYGNAGQDVIFGDLGRRVIDHAFAGFNSSVFAYGQTGRCARVVCGVCLHVCLHMCEY